MGHVASFVRALRWLFGQSAASRREVVRVVLDHTLMRLDPQLEVHVQSGNISKMWFLEIPEAWLGRGNEIEAALHEIFRRENARLRRNEPGDPNYLAMTGFRHERVSSEDRGPYPWEQEAKIVWETSNCFCVDRADRIVPFLPTAFTNLVLLRRLASGEIGPPAFREIALGRYDGNQGLIDKIIADPPSFLDLALKMGAGDSGWR